MAELLRSRCPRWKRHPISSSVWCFVRSTVSSPGRPMCAAGQRHRHARALGAVRELAHLPYKEGVGGSNPSAPTTAGQTASTTRPATFPRCTQRSALNTAPVGRLWDKRRCREPAQLHIEVRRPRAVGNHMTLWDLDPAVRRRRAGPSPRSRCQSSCSVDRGQAAARNVPSHVGASSVRRLLGSPQGAQDTDGSDRLPGSDDHRNPTDHCPCAAQEVPGHELPGGSVPRGRGRMVSFPRPSSVRLLLGVRPVHDFQALLGISRQHPQPASTKSCRREDSSKRCAWINTTRRVGVSAHGEGCDLWHVLTAIVSGLIHGGSPLRTGLPLLRLRHATCGRVVKAVAVCSHCRLTRPSSVL